jgi:hypothetical protein
MECLRALARLSTHSALALALGTAAVPAADQYQSFRAAAAQVLARREDADSLAAAAALGFPGPAHDRTEAAAHRTAAVELARKASELDPANPGIGWLRLQLCANTPGCDIRDAATTMRWVDADNAAAWMATLAVAHKDKDAMEVDRILTEMAQGRRFDLYWNRTVVQLFDALKRTSGELPAKYLPSDAARLSEAMGVAAADIIPSFSPLLNACRESADVERRESCSQLARIMQHADTVIAQLAGFSLEKRLSPPDSKEARTVAERRRVLEWRVSTLNQSDASMLSWLTSARARARVAKMRALPREEDVAIAILRARKLPLEPPEGAP